MTRFIAAVLSPFAPCNATLVWVLLAGAAAVVFVTGVVAAAEDKPLAYHAIFDRSEPVSEVSGSPPAPGLPASLVIPPGRYAVHGRTYDLSREGLYRFCLPMKDNQQRIVYDDAGGSVEALLSGLAWVATHGVADDAKSHDALERKATTDKLFIQCGTISAWAVPLLARHKVRARVVGSCTLDEWNTYDNGHVMIEVFRKDVGKWVLYDLDANACFFHEKSPLSLVEMIERSAAGDYEIKPLAADTTLDVSNFKVDGYNFALYGELAATGNGLRRWYRRVLQVPQIDGLFYLPTPNDADRRRIERGRGGKYLEKDEFVKRFYVEAKP